MLRPPLNRNQRDLGLTSCPVSVAAHAGLPERSMTTAFALTPVPPESAPGLQEHDASKELDSSSDTDTVEVDPNQLTFDFVRRGES